MMSLTFGLFTQVSGSVPLGPLVVLSHLLADCDIGVWFSVCRPVSPSIRLSVHNLC